MTPPTVLLAVAKFDVTTQTRVAATRADNTIDLRIGALSSAG